jgi:EpsI family protein
MTKPEDYDVPPKSNAPLGRRAVIGGVMALASGIAYARQPKASMPLLKKESFEDLVPGPFGSWKVSADGGVVLPPPDSLRDRLYDNLVTRVYSAPDFPPVMTLLAYNNEQDGVLQVHRPEVCYPVGGFKLSATEPINIPLDKGSVPANIFTAEAPGRVEQVMYFTRLGTAFPRSWLEQRMAVIKANLAGEIPDGIMMRVSVIGINQQRAKPILEQFTRAFISASPSRLQKLLVG